MRVRIDEIKVKNRVRRNPGDLTPLKDSMRKHGLLHPIVIDPSNILVSGFRRLEAAKDLGWETIEARLIEVRSKKERLQIEAEENLVRRDFTQAELERTRDLMNRYSRTSIFGKFMAWLMDIFDRLFGR